ncbi:MAG: hypothetical protein HOI66_06870 [Verrucomicrobia bacterium]|jgi:hypothetical protein|nr:hypothetical protein [Verrucomicrobiota bacterium]MDA7645352.1 hypothetical protein [bacterium]
MNLIGVFGQTSLASVLMLAVAASIYCLGDSPDEGSALLRDWDVSGYAETELRGFADSPKFDGQRSRVGHSFAFEPEFYRDWSDGDWSFEMTPFGRYDGADSERSHVDLREFHIQRIADQWEWRVGVSKVFWGVTESQHLVDVINQTDLVENVDGEDKLGQPMVNLSWISDQAGVIDLFYLPYFRERTFPGRGGRLRWNPYVETRDPIYESSLEEWHPDVAFRWSRTFGDLDIGVGYFRGTSRDPLFVPRVIPGRDPVLLPVYNLIHQTGVDAQWTRNAWLLKFEGIYRDGRGQHFGAVVSGFEYTLYGVFGTNADLGLLSEYHFDSRQDSALTPFNQDIFGGVRLALNDSQDSALLAGGVYDHDTTASSLRFEFERRLGNDYFVSVEGQWFANVVNRDLISFFSDDSFVQLSLRRYF